MPATGKQNDRRQTITAMGKEEFGMLEEIFREYVRELSAENGDVFFYAARTYVNGERLLKSYNSYFTNDNQLCFPIPSRELEINFLATQNPY